MLSRAFIQIEKKHAMIYKRMRSLLPRRESERKVHPLFRHCDILSSIETRLSMLNMTYSKYIQSNMCCFMPGKVLDELEKVLAEVQQPSLPRPHELLQELRDISSMAMEYFDEKILPVIKDQQSSTDASLSGTSRSYYKSSKICVIQPSIQEDISKIRKRSRKQRLRVNVLWRTVHKLVSKVRRQEFVFKNHTRLLREKNNKIIEQSTKIADHETTIADLSRQVGDWNEKYAQLTSDMVRTRDEIVHDFLFKSNLQSEKNQIQEVNKTVGNFPEEKDNALKMLIPRTIIKPRLSQIQSPNTYIMELERKRKSSLNEQQRCEGLPPFKFRFVLAPDEQTKMTKPDCKSNAQNSGNLLCAKLADKVNKFVELADTTNEIFTRNKSRIQTHTKSIRKPSNSSVVTRRSAILHRQNRPSNERNQAPPKVDNISSDIKPSQTNSATNSDFSWVSRVFCSPSLENLLMKNPLTSNFTNSKKRKMIEDIQVSNKR